jgi:hypothetical protein
MRQGCQRPGAAATDFPPMILQPEVQIGLRSAV